MCADSTVVIAQLFPDLLGTYGDSGNAAVLQRRLEWRGILSRVLPVTAEDPIPASCDVYLLGGGEDAAQRLAVERLVRYGAELRQAVERGAPALAVCAGMQILGREFAGAQGEPLPGMGLLDLVTTPRRQRAVGEVVVEPDRALLDEPLTGFENHRGATRLGPAARPLGRVRAGVGNGAGIPVDGAVQGRVLGTYLHGPVLARNPQLADLLLGWVVGEPLAPLPIPAVEELRRTRLGSRLGRRRESAHRSPAGPDADGADPAPGWRVHPRRSA
ncbi:type 1 glutamine amidotransferase [Pseudonocardia acidicola]|uniref:Lipid II isoglutaminyl synthase (glutamine-hydrolyzing) subunit GatD n=1 Tax=Pseudonocardia acidicola TaxID=2724939 RepID=A0ABX1SCH9_9PSEU|nr:glutamine amidotransferase [Pseudonocardia acidicola]NMH99281.1 glutamine amidotransferase [Pseudonocardia acidicola]